MIYKSMPDLLSLSLYAQCQAKLRESKIFNSLLKAQNLCSSSGLVKYQLVVYQCSYDIEQYLLWLVSQEVMYYVNVVSS